MKLTTMLMAVVVAAMEAQAGSHKPQASALVTVFTYDRIGVPGDVMLRAKLVVTMAFSTAGVEVRWAEGKRPGEPREVASGEVRTVVFDGPAPAHASPQAMAFTNVGGGADADADIHVFYNRVAGFAHFYWSGAHLSELLGNVVAHELTHALEGVARHSSEGLMKAHWSGPEYARMADRHPLALAAEDLELLHAHFKKEIRPALTIVASW